jgi:transketolase
MSWFNDHFNQGTVNQTGSLGVSPPGENFEAEKDYWDRLAVKVIRGLAMDAPRKANSGHPGTAMALAPLAHVLFTRIMDYDPGDPNWPDRDRFVLSCGHASILLYSMLYLTGYGLELEDLKAFRQLHSKTPGHPESGLTPGVEVTTGPLGQGFANAVGMAMAERWLRARFGPATCDHHTFFICSDGDLEEGITHEAASLAGHLGLGHLVGVYDDNHISIDGPTELAFTEDVGKRFEAYGWQVIHLGERGEDMDAIEAAILEAKAEAERPSLVILRSHIGYPSPHLTDTAKAHGDPFDPEEIRLTKQILGIPPDEAFWVPQELLSRYRQALPRGKQLRESWEARQEERFKGAEEERQLWEACLSGRPLDGLRAKMASFEPGSKVATRRAIQTCLRSIQDRLPGLIAGSADLTGNTGVLLQDTENQSIATPLGRQVHYGIREHAMASIMNGMALHRGVLPVGATFFVFTDYLRPALRLAALSKAHVLFSFTHDSIGLGEDGPTHQPIEHLASLRAMPGLTVMRPADANETAACLSVALTHEGPVALVLSRQDLPVLTETQSRESEVARGAYVLRDSKSPEGLQIVLIGTGSEVQLCLGAQEELEASGIGARVVSMPCWELFEEQSEEWRSSVLPPGVPVFSVEAGSVFGWTRWANASLGIDHFGLSAPGSQAMEACGFTVENVSRLARELLSKSSSQQIT